MTTLSVVLATHDGARFLPEQLASLSAQDRPPDELVVYDDASGDESLEVLAAFAAEAPFPVRVERGERRLGPRAAFERALLAADGQLLALCDQDDRWRPEKLLVLEAAMASTRTTLAFSDATVIDEGGRPTRDHLWRELGFGRRQQDALASSPPGALLRHAVASGCTLVVRREVLEVALPFPAVLGLAAAPMLHDRWLSLVAGCSGRVAVVPAPLVEYREHPAQVVGARWAPAGRQAGQLGRPTDDVRARAEARLRQLDVLEDRLLAAAEPLAPGVAEQLEDLRRYLVCRADLPDRRARRLLPVGREVANGGYRRFGSGPGSALLDLLRR